MSDTSQSLSHARWHGKYHVVVVPKRRREALFGHIRKALGPIFHELARPKGMPHPGRPRDARSRA